VTLEIISRHVILGVTFTRFTNERKGKEADLYSAYCQYLDH